MTFTGDCIGSSVPGDARLWLFSSIPSLVCKLPSCEVVVNKGVGPLRDCCCCLSFSSVSSDTRGAV